MIRKGPDHNPKHTHTTVPASFTKLYKHAHVINQPDDVNSIKTLL